MAPRSALTYKLFAHQVHTTTGNISELLTSDAGLSSPGGVALFLGGTAAVLSDAGTHQLV